MDIHHRRPARFHHWTAAALLAAAQPLLPAPAGATDVPITPPGEPRWEVGVAGGTGRQSAYPGSAQTVGRSLGSPYFIYRGRVLRVGDGGLGVRAYRSATMQLDVGFAGSLGSDSKDSTVRQGMPDIGTLVEFGPRLRVALPADPESPWRQRLSLPLRAVLDTDDGFRHRGWIFEPQFSAGRPIAPRVDLNLGASLIFGSRELADTFYGVAPVFATATRPAYEARAGFIASRLQASVSWRPNDDVRLFTFARVDSVAGGANARSPLVEQRTGVAVGIGASWVLARSRRAAD
jgi:outer membrane scaffolding protein for murein synthesis (MipA/OmpV family)